MRQFTVVGRIGRYLLIVTGLSLMYGCGSAGEAGDTNADSAHVDLSDQFNRQPGDADADSGAGWFRRSMTVIRKGQRREALVMVAPIRLRAPLGGVGGDARLVGLATPVFNIGDGVQLDVLLATDREHRLIGSRFFDSGRRSEDREWIPLSFPLTLGETTEWLELRVSGGPQGDLVGDWLALSDLRLSPAKSEARPDGDPK